jgi:hypothetical protein
MNSNKTQPQLTRPLSYITLWVAVSAMMLGTAQAQTTLIVSEDPTTSTVWEEVLAPGGGSFFGDDLSDQQTGQGQDDMVGSATDPGFWIGQGTIAGEESIGFRVQLDKVGNKTEYTGNFRIGLEIEGDDDVDLFLGPKLGGNANNQGIMFQLPGSDLNDAPNTTSLGNNTDRIAFTSDNYNYKVNPNDPVDFNGTPDAILTFALSFADLNAYISANWSSIYNGGGTVPAAPVLSSSSVFRFIAFTATQSNSINQDLFGVNGIGSTRFTDGGGFSAPTFGDGSSAIPEPATFFSVGLLLVYPLCRRRRRTSE